MSERKNEKEPNLYDYHKHNLIYISDYIKFADAKAGVALGANLLMLGFYGQQLKKIDFLSLFLRNDVQLMIAIPILAIIFTLLFHFFIFDFIRQQIQKHDFFLNSLIKRPYLFLVLYSIVSAITIGINASISSSFFFNKIKYFSISLLPDSETILTLLLIFGLMLLVVSCYFLLLKVLWPRYVVETDYYMSWGGISGFRNDSEYLKKLDSVDLNTFVNDMAKQNHSLAQVCAKKYTNLKYGFRYLILGAPITILCWFLLEIK
ncbi:Pycsar system effector family protein [Exiguobacterium sp. CH10]|uniref:Pycsar system effector family protein n=1 Tax=Exiguobacterium sp. CH10 TaxID=2751261 RepID=UPI001BEB28AC|nr:Pycsar system effector family protein [Exiguobacterium sp. CH10]